MHIAGPQLLQGVVSLLCRSSLHPMIDFRKEEFGPVIRYPHGVVPVVLDLSGKSAASFGNGDWTIGKYDEVRGIYASSSALFAPERNIHIGIDLGGPVGTPVYLPYRGVVVQQGYYPEKGDYGHCVISEHVIQGVRLWLLFGHLDAKSVHHAIGTDLDKGYCIGYLGAEEENGGWPPHLHFQLSYREPV
jgi:murein DD-endopeptidase MepM/ murein hydrolase activator NlpD